MFNFKQEAQHGESDYGLFLAVCFAVGYLDWGGRSRDAMSLLGVIVATDVIGRRCKWSIWVLYHNEIASYA